MHVKIAARIARAPTVEPDSAVERVENVILNISVGLVVDVGIDAPGALLAGVARDGCGRTEGILESSGSAVVRQSIRIIVVEDDDVVGNQSGGDQRGTARISLVAVDAAVRDFGQASGLKIEEVDAEPLRVTRIARMISAVDDMDAGSERVGGAAATWRNSMPLMVTCEAV